MKTCGYLVTKGGALCSLLNVSGLNRGGVLLPGDPSESYTVLELRRFSQRGECQLWASNFEKLLTVVVEKEAAEIAELNGRAA